jgi:hypothetical protein
MDMSTICFAKQRSIFTGRAIDPQEMLEEILMEARKFQAVFGRLKRAALLMFC